MITNDGFGNENFDDMQKQNNINSDETEQAALSKKITEMLSSIENLKKKLSQIKEEESLLDKKIKKLLDVIEIKKVSIQRLDVTIKLLDNKFGEKFTRKKYTDELKRKNNLKEDSVCRILKYIGDFETDPNAKSWLKNWQSIKNQKILKTEKLKLMKYLGQCSKSIENLFDIDDTNFNNMQKLIERIFSQKEVTLENTEDKISGNIHLKVFFKDTLTSEELEKLHLETENENNYHIFKIAIIDYDFFYNVNDSKLKIIEIKLLACTFFGIDLNEYLLVDDIFRIWPYDLVLFDEILQMNLEKNYVRKNCKFFHLNPIISQNIKLILVSRKYFEQICVTFDDLKFVEKSIISRNSLIAKFFKTRIEDKKNDLIMLNEGVQFKNKSQNNENLTHKILKEKIKSIFREMYRLSEEKDARKIDYKLILPSSENQNILNKSNLKDRSDLKMLQNEQVNRDDNLYNNFQLTQKLKNKIKNNYSDVLEEFSMDDNNLLEYFDLIFQQRLKIREFEIEEDAKFEEFKKINSTSLDDPLEVASLKLIYNKDNKLIPKKRLTKDKDELKTKDQIKRLIDDYLKRERVEKEKIKSNNPDNFQEEKIQNFGSNSQIVKKEGELESSIKIEEKSKKPTKLKKAKELLNFIPTNQIGGIIRVVEFLCVLLYFIFSHLDINQVPIQELNFLNSKMMQTFNKKEDCIQKFQEIQSPVPMNDWILGCLIPT